MRHPWTWPLRWRVPLLPDEPGRFGTEVVAVEDGVVVAVEWFTGKHVRTPDGEPAGWWNDTQVVIVQGASGFVAYGEVTPTVPVGTRVRAGQPLAVVDTAVLRSFKGRPMVMLHLEVYSAIEADPKSWAPSHTAWWEKRTPKPPNLHDPTPWLVASLHEYTAKFPHPCDPSSFHFDLSRYDGTSFRDPDAPSKPSRWWAVWGGSP